ncbi:MAG: helicase-associated domain-containing protein [Actinobacteria bacterium]|nr:helicase-associated domain-containing protein [Actinomycetota bacterium]
MVTFTSALRARSDTELVELLRRRPDLASPSPSTFASLAVRATSRAGLERALTRLDAAALQVLEAVVALGGPVDRETVLEAVAGPGPGRETVERSLADVLVRALLWEDADGLHAAPGLAEQLGPYPAGLAPADPRVDRSAPQDVEAALAQAPPGARPVLDALTWGPPVGQRPAPATRADTAVAWLVSRGLLAQTGGRRVVLPRPVALSLRGGRTHRAPALPPAPDAGTRLLPLEVVAAESASAAAVVVRLVTRLLTVWGDPPPALRSGGLGVRDLRRTATDLGVDEQVAAFVIELSAAAGLVGHEVVGPVPAFAPTQDGDDWLNLELAVRWSLLARAWLGTARAPWLVGTKDERGSTRTALHPDGQRPWVPALRRSVLDTLALLPAGSAPTADGVRRRLAWRTPRAVPPVAAVEALLVEAGRLGVLGAGALSAAGRALLEPSDDPAARLAADLPEPVDRILLQGDLTGVVPGRPTDDLAALLERTSEVESRGGALTVRFTAGSVSGALDAGLDPDELLARLAEASLVPVPQPLEYLVRDTARRHGRLRIGAAASYLRSADPALLAPLVGDPRLVGLGLAVLAPTVLVAQVSAVELAQALRAAGLSPVTEAPDGHVLDLAVPPRRARPRAHRPALDAHDPGPGLAAVVAVLRSADVLADDEPPTGRSSAAGLPAAGLPAAGLSAAGDRTGSGQASRGGTGRTRPGAPPAPAGGTPPPPAGTAEPAAALLLLREALAERQEVWVEMVGPSGALQRRLLRPVRLEGGRLRALDTAREAELTVAVHRIASVTRASTTPSTTGSAP